MCKKLSLLVSFVLMLGSVSNAADIQWTDLGADHLWSNPENWEPVRVPTLADEVLIDVPAAAEPNGPVIQDGIDAKAKGILTEAAGEPTLTITGGTLEVADYIWYGDGNGSFGIWTMSGGTVDVANEFELGWDGGAGTLTMTGGTISAGEAVIPTDTGAFGELFLQGGTYSVTKADGLQMNANGLIDISEGALVLEGDDTAKVNGLIAAGQITAYGGAGQIEMDFDVRNPGKTTLTAIERVTFLFDDFESYAADVILGAFGWTILDTPEAIEASTWTITNPGGRGNPATLDGSASTGQFLISDSDQQSESNPVDSGASHDISTPSFSTLGGMTVWLHADVSAQLNNNGAAIFDVEVSTDGGGTWTNVFSRVAPGRVSAEGATTRLPDNTNADGYFGRLDVDISAVAANQADVQVRFRHYEPNWDWWIAIDNVLIDNVAAPQGGPITVFSEDFSNGLGQMNVVSGQGNTGTETWHTTDKGGRYVPGAVGEQGVNRLGPHPNEHPEFAIIDADPDPPEDEWLMTPSLDLSDMAEVFLHYESETVMSSGVLNQEVLVSLDGGSTFEATPIFAYTGGGLFDNGEEPVYAARIFDVSGTAAGQSQVVFAFLYAGDGDNWWWAIDNVKVTGTPLPEPVDPGTGNLVRSWTFDDGTADDVVGDAEGVLIGDAAVVDGQLVLDGDGDWMDMPGDVIAMNTFEGLTIEIMFTSVAGGNTGYHMVTAFGEEGTGDNPGYGYKYVCITPARGNDVSRGMIQTVSMDNDPWSEETGVSDVIEHDDGLPHHMVCTVDDTELAFYIDGVLIGTAALDPPGNSIAGLGTDVAHIGKGVYGVDPLWAGSVDYLNLYNRALSGGEVRYLAGHRAPVDPGNEGLVVDQITSPSLEGNLLGDPATREVIVYLPPSYNQGGNFPVVYLLHGYTGNARTFASNAYTGFYWPAESDFPEGGIYGLLNDLIIAGELKEMIVVMPDASNMYGGSWYANSELAGNYEDYIVEDLVSYIDSNYRTIPSRDSRAIVGHSMGGYGAMKLAMKHPDIFGAVASHGGALYLEVLKGLIPAAFEENPAGMTGPAPDKPMTSVCFAMSAAFSPNLANPPFFVDLPFEYPSPEIIDEVWNRFMEHDVLTMLGTYGTNVSSLRGIYMDAGAQDEFASNLQTDAFHQALDAAGIGHECEIYSGTHYDRLFERLAISLKFLSDALGE